MGDGCIQLYPKIVYFMEFPTKMDDLRGYVLIFKETSICLDSLSVKA